MTVETFRNRIAHRVGQRFFFGWVILFAAGMGFFVSGAGQSHLFSVFIGPIGADLGITSTAIASAYAAATLVAAAGLPFMHSMMGTLPGQAEWFATMEAAGVPMFNDSESMAECAALLARYPACLLYTF